MHQYLDITVVADSSPFIDERFSISESDKQVTAPDVWSMPNRGIEWCDCGKHHVLERSTVEHFATRVIGDPQWMTHHELIDATMDLWNYSAVCEFFLMAIRASANAVNGVLAPKYRYERGLEIVAYFSKTWQGCPEVFCRSVHEPQD